MGRQLAAAGIFEQQRVERIERELIERSRKIARTWMR
jgi:hypothetical protein